MVFWSCSSQADTFQWVNSSGQFGCYWLCDLSFMCHLATRKKKSIYKFKVGAAVLIWSISTREVEWWSREETTFETRQRSKHSCKWVWPCMNLSLDRKMGAEVGRLLVVDLEVKELEDCLATLFLNIPSFICVLHLHISTVFCTSVLVVFLYIDWFECFWNY